MKKYHDLVLLADGNARQAPALARGFRALGCGVAALCASKTDVCAVSRFVDRAIIDRECRDRAEVRAERILREIRENRYTLVVACADRTAEQLSLRHDEIAPYARTSVAPPGIFYRAFDKLQTMRLCAAHRIPCPKTVFGCASAEEVLRRELTFPLVVKPRCGYGAIGFHRLDSRAALASFLAAHAEDLPRLLLQEYIPQTDIQYEAAVFAAMDGAVSSVTVFEKNRWFPVHGGSSTLNTTVRDAAIAESCSRLLTAMGWRGCADVDLIRDPRDGEAKILEVNPRMSASARLLFLSGVDLALQLLQQARGEAVTPFDDYEEGVRLRCLYTDLLWFLRSPDRFRARPPWLSLRRTHEQVFSLHDPLPFCAFSLSSLRRLPRELKKRGG